VICSSTQLRLGLSCSEQDGSRKNSCEVIRSSWLQPDSRSLSHPPQKWRQRKRSISWLIMQTHREIRIDTCDELEEHGMDLMPHCCGE